MFAQSVVMAVVCNDEGWISKLFSNDKGWPLGLNDFDGMTQGLSEGSQFNLENSQLKNGNMVYTSNPHSILKYENIPN